MTGKLPTLLEKAYQQWQSLTQSTATQGLEPNHYESVKPDIELDNAFDPSQTPITPWAEIDELTRHL